MGRLRAGVTMRSGSLWVVFVGFITATGCKDKAKPDFDYCAILANRDEQGDLQRAVVQNPRSGMIVSTRRREKRATTYWAK